MGLPQLLEVADRPLLTVTPRSAAPVVWRGEAGGTAVLLAGTAPPDVVELWSWTLAPGGRYTSGAHTDGTRELLTVDDGSVVLEVGDESVLLRTGDTASFAGTEPHAYAWADGAGGARFTLVTLQPGVGRVDPQHPGPEHQ